jgi:hypothetical protein
MNKNSLGFIIPIIKAWFFVEHIFVKLCLLELRVPRQKVSKNLLFSGLVDKIGT